MAIKHPQRQHYCPNHNIIYFMTSGVWPLCGEECTTVPNVVLIGAKLTLLQNTSYVTSKRYILRQNGGHLSDAAFNKELHATNQKSLRYGAADTHIHKHTARQTNTKITITSLCEINYILLIQTHTGNSVHDRDWFCRPNTRLWRGYTLVCPPYVYLHWWRNWVGASWQSWTAPFSLHQRWNRIENDTKLPVPRLHRCLCGHVLVCRTQFNGK